VTEPVPTHGEHVPDTVLDELKLAFGLADTGPDPFSDPDVTVLPDAVVDDDAIALALAAAGDIEADAAAAPAPEPAIAAPVVPLFESDSVRVIPVDRVVPVDPMLAARAADPSRPSVGGPVTHDASEASGVGAEPVGGRSTIVIGGDDDLPDAVYLDDAGPIATRTGPDDSSARATIVIGDELDSTGAFDAVSVPARSMDPRVRARRIAVKRAAGRKRLVWTSVVVGLVAAVVAVLAVFSSSLFAVETVDVQGATYTSARNDAQLQAVIDDLRGEPVLLVDTRRAEVQLEQIPWIERAFVTTDFPNRVLIDVRERLPLATYAGSDERFRVIDRDGRVLDVLDGRPADYMLLSGTGPDLEPGALAGTPFAQAAQLVGALPAELRARTVSASVDATTGDLGLVLQGDVDPDAPGVTPPDIEVRLGNASGLDSKLARLLQQTRDGLDGVARLDVSTDEVIRSPI
jgi:cell division protein FtsQ